MFVKSSEVKHPSALCFGVLLLTSFHLPRCSYNIAYKIKFVKHNFATSLLCSVFCTINCTFAIFRKKWLIFIKKYFKISNKCSLLKIKIFEFTFLGL